MLGKSQRVVVEGGGLGPHDASALLNKSLRQAVRAQFWDLNHLIMLQ